MPEISRFYGIIIAMYYMDHNPPHFHAKYGDYAGVFTIPDLKLIEGHLPRRALSLVLEWAFEYRDELSKNWDLAVASEPLSKIHPLT